MTGDYLLREVYIQPMNSSRALDFLRSAADPSEPSGDPLGAFYAIGISGSTQFKALTLHRLEADDPLPELSVSRPGTRIEQRRMQPAPGPDPLADDAGRCAAPLFAYEVTTVRDGAERDYLRAVREEREPTLRDHGHRLVGGFCVGGEAKVVTLWACDVEAHIGVHRAYDAALGLDEENLADTRLLAWRRRAREFVVGPWREHLMVPYPHTVLAPR